MEENKTKKVAVVTYNRIGEGQYNNGVLRRGNTELYIAQNGHKAKWAAMPEGGNHREKRINTIRDVVNRVELAEMDQVVLYVGAGGGEEAIKQTSELPAEKVTYVMCDCNGYRKRQMIRNVGNAEAGVIWCECGGRHTLERMVKELLEE